MTQEEKAKAYDEALKKIRPLYEQAKKEDCPIWSTYEYIFPELAESEDDRTIKELETFINQPEIADKITFEARIGWLAWLEKQKEPHYTKRNALFDKCVENCDPEVMKEVSNETDEMLQKEQKPTNSEKPKEWSDEQMLKEAVEGRIHTIGFHNTIYIKEPEWTDKLDKYEEGDKVRVIVLPMEDEK